MLGAAENFQSKAVRVITSLFQPYNKHCFCKVQKIERKPRKSENKLRAISDSFRATKKTNPWQHAATKCKNTLHEQFQRLPAQLQLDRRRSKEADYDGPSTVYTYYLPIWFLVCLRLVMNELCFSLTVNVMQHNNELISFLESHSYIFHKIMQ